MPEIVAIVAAVTALFAVVLGPLISLWSTQKQASVAVRSTNRQAWINTLRENVSEFISAAALVCLSFEGDGLRDKFERLLFLEAKIKLLLNPTKDDHRRIIEAVVAAREAAALTLATRSDDAVSGLNQRLEAIVPMVQALLKSQWERVKRAE